MTFYLEPSDSGYYADPLTFPTAQLEALADRAAYNGSFIAANSGADHPMATEWLAILTAVTGELLRRGVTA